MQVICTDGTVLECDRFEAIDSGVLLFDEQRSTAGEEEDEDEAEREDEAFGFVPIHSVRYVLPEGAARGGRGMGQPAQQPTPGGTGGQPPMGTSPGAGGPPQQSMGGRQQGPGSSQRGPGPQR